jgi:two-component system phosphate regulon sensor histidine kinase PhoR
MKNDRQQDVEVPGPASRPADSLKRPDTAKRTPPGNSEPCDTAGPLARMRDWHDDFESRIDSLISYLQDLGSRSKQARVECSRNYSKIADLTRAKTRFTYEVSHEIKAPLAAVYNVLNVVIEGYLKDDREKQMDLLIRARYRVREIIALLNDLLTLSLLEESTGRLKKEPLDLRAVLVPVYEEMQEYAVERQVRFSWQWGDELPVLLGSPELLRRVFVNIVDNAIKYTDPGGTVEVEARKDGDTFLFRVADTGVGIPDEELPKVFDIFFRGSKARAESKAEGMGLGLSLVKRIVDDHRGTISVSSRFGLGTTMTVRFLEYTKGGAGGETGAHG